LIIRRGGQPASIPVKGKGYHGLAVLVDGPDHFAIRHIP
jgi:hypothetical protein